MYFRLRNYDFSVNKKEKIGFYYGLRKEIQTNVFESELFDKIDMIAGECLQVVKHTGKTSSKDFSF